MEIARVVRALVGLAESELNDKNALESYFYD
jgi:hypothetical protein